MSEKLEDGIYFGKFRGESRCMPIRGDRYAFHLEGFDSVHNNFPLSDGDFKPLRRIATLDGRPVVDESVIDAIACDIEAALPIYGFRKEITAAIRKHLCPTKPAEGDGEDDIRSSLAQHKRLYDHAIECVDVAFQTRSNGPKPILPDFCVLGEDKFKAVVRLAEAYKEATAERDKLLNAISAAGFQVMKTSGDWSIHDVSELAKWDEDRTAEVIAQNIDLEAERDRLQARVAELEGHLQRWNEANTPFEYTDPRIEIYQPEGRKYYGWRVKGLDSAPFTTWREAYQRAAGYLDYAEQVAIVRELKENLEAAAIERDKLKRELDAAVEHHGRWINKLCALLPGFQRHSGDLLHNICCEIERLKTLAELEQQSVHRYRDAKGDVWVALPEDEESLRGCLRLRDRQYDRVAPQEFAERFTLLADESIVPFSKRNRERCESPHGFNHALSSWSMSDWATATLGELGEAANVVKKLNRYRDGIPGNTVSEADLRQQLADEIADTAIYLDLFAQAAGFDLETIRESKFERTSAKIGFTRTPPITLPPEHERLVGPIAKKLGKTETEVRDAILEAQGAQA